MSGSAKQAFHVAQWTATLIVLGGVSACGDGVEPPLETPNRPPVSTGAIPTQSVEVGQTQGVDVSQYFDDPDGDALSYTAETSDVTVATTSVAGSVVTVAGVAKGTAAVSVTATDPSGLTASQSFEVTVPNQRPVSIDSIPTLNLQSGDSVTVDLSDLFEDPDGDSLSFTAETSDARVATGLAQNSLVTIRALGEGTATVSVVATDTDGAFVMLQAMVTVTNLPPVLVGPIPPQRVKELQSVTVGLMEHFQDPEGGDLTFSATVSDSSLARAVVSETTMVVTGVAAGAATITVTGTDLGGLSAQQVVGLAVEPLSERDVLEAIYHSMDGPNWTHGGWLTDAPLRHWYGVRVEDGRVRKLVLPGNNLAGAIPPEIGYLTDIEFINFTRNKITAIPPEIGRLVNLSGLWLTDNQLVVIPPEIGELSSLRGLEVGENHLTSLPPEIFNLTNLQRLYLWRNQLTGPIPPELGSLANLTWLSLGYNNLTGPIPSELGNLTNLTLLSLVNNNLEGPIPAEIGNLSNMTELSFGQNRLTGSIPAALGNLDSLERIVLDGNNLTGSIPPALGTLANLQVVRLGGNRLSGAIPPEFANLSNLKSLFLRSNELSGTIPPELGDLTSVERIDLFGNSLTGAIPPELGNLTNLLTLGLAHNELSGRIPPELGNLTSLEGLSLPGNDLSGPIPTELGNLTSLRFLSLQDNNLSGPLPPELGYLSSLVWLSANDNQLSGAIPADLGNLNNLGRLWLARNHLTGPVAFEFGRLTSLQVLDLTDNDGMVGILPHSLTDLAQITEFHASGTNLCAPRDLDFQRWLSRILDQRVATCSESGVSMAYLTQAVQSFHFPVPLIEGEEALLRVFVVDDDAGGEYIPPVRATFYHDGSEAGVFDIPQGSGTIPDEVVEGDLNASADANIPADLIRPGLEMVIEIDPDGTLDTALNLTTRIPESGRVEIDVRAVPELRFVVIPFLWNEAPDSAILDQTNGMASDPSRHELLWGTRTLLPVNDVFVDRHEPVLTSSNSARSLAGEALAIQAMEGTQDLYLGMMSGPVEGGLLGSATFRGAGFAVPRSNSIAHTIGHFVGLGHAPCGVPDPDPGFPSANGVIGAWGYDFRDGGHLIPPTQPDLMSGCRERWISEYYFGYALRYRLTPEGTSDASPQTPAQSLLLWGGLSLEGVPYLEPVFVVDAPPALPQSAGDHEITGWTSAGDTLFSLAFDLALAAYPDPSQRFSQRFAFVLPVDQDWADIPSTITFSGPSGIFTMDGDTKQPMIVLRNPQTGAIRGILRDPPLGLVTQAGYADAASAYPGHQVLFSRGIPDSTAWRR